MCADCPPSISVSKTNWLNEVAELPLLSTAGILVVIAGVKAVSALPVTLALLIENVGRQALGNATWDAACCLGFANPLIVIV